MPAPYIELLAARLEECRRGKIRRLIVNLPPRSLKSHAVSIAFPAFLLGHNPSVQVICASYGQDLADKLARAKVSAALPRRTISVSPSKILLSSWTWESSSARSIVDDKAMRSAPASPFWTAAASALALLALSKQRVRIGNIRWPSSVRMACGRAHRLANRASVSLADLGAERLVLVRHGEHAEALAAFLRKGNVPLDRCHEVYSDDDLMKLVADGAGVAVVPRSLPASHAATAMQVEGLDLRRRVYLFGIAGRPRAWHRRSRTSCAPPIGPPRPTEDQDRSAASRSSIVMRLR